MSPKIVDYVVSYKSISDRVAYLDIRLPTRNGNHKLIRFVNAYGPTSPLAKKNPKEISKFYNQLSKAIKIPSRQELYILGDFNAKLGTVTHEDREEGIITNHMGRYGTGKRNENGEQLLNFLLSHDLLACNTTFQHPCRHRTTRVGFIPKPGRAKNSKETVPTFVQIDYILCRRESRFLLNDARSYENGRTVIKSDHKLVLARLNLSKQVLIHKKQKKRHEQYDINNLIADPSVKEKYQTALSEELVKLDNLQTPNKKLEDLFQFVKTSAASTVGIKQPTKQKHYSQDSQLLDLVEKRTQLRVQLTTDGKAKDRTDLRSQINKKEKDIQNRLSEIATSKAEHLCSIIG